MRRERPGPLSFDKRSPRTGEELEELLRYVRANLVVDVAEAIDKLDAFDDSFPHVNKEPAAVVQAATATTREAKAISFIRMWLASKHVKKCCVWQCPEVATRQHADRRKTTYAWCHGHLPSADAARTEPVENADLVHAALKLVGG